MAANLLFTSVTSTTWRAPANAASVASLLPMASVKQTLPVQSGQIFGAPSRAASSTVTTADSGSYSTSTRAAASRAAAAVPATTKATRSPTWRTVSVTSRGRNVR